MHKLAVALQSLKSLQHDQQLVSIMISMYPMVTLSEIDLFISELFVVAIKIELSMITNDAPAYKTQCTHRLYLHEQITKASLRMANLREDIIAMRLGINEMSFGWTPSDAPVPYASRDLDIEAAMTQEYIDNYPSMITIRLRFSMLNTAIALVCGRIAPDSDSITDIIRANNDTIIIRNRITEIKQQVEHKIMNRSFNSNKWERFNPNEVLLDEQLAAGTITLDEFSKKTQALSDYVEVWDSNVFIKICLRCYVDGDVYFRKMDKPELCLIELYGQFYPIYRIEKSQKLLAEWHTVASITEWKTMLANSIQYQVSNHWTGEIYTRKVSI